MDCSAGLSLTLRKDMERHGEGEYGDGRGIHLKGRCYGEKGYHENSFVGLAILFNPVRSVESCIHRFIN